MPTYTTPGPVDVRIDLPLGETRVIASDRDTTVVDVLGDDDAIRCEFSGNQLTLSATADRGGVVGWGLGMLGLGPGSGATVTVEVPTGSDLHATTRYGSLSTEGSLGTCQVRTEYGDVHLDEAGPVGIRSRHSDLSIEHATADLEITTSSGDVRVGVVEGSASITNNDSDIVVTEARGPLQLRGSHGDMTIERLHADLLARNAYGSIRVTEVVEGSCDIATTYGEVEIGIAEGTAAWLDVRSDTGTVRNRLDQQPGPDEFDHTAELRARTRDGDVLIRRGRPSPTRPHRFWKH
jgi:F0F1-type ATP synthase epsilon subunit